MVRRKYVSAYRERLPRLLSVSGQNCFICALAKNAMLWRFCLRSERLRVPRLARSPSSPFRRTVWIKSNKGYPDGYPLFEWCAGSTFLLIEKGYLVYCQPANRCASSALSLKSCRRHDFTFARNDCAFLARHSRLRVPSSLLYRKI